LAYTLAYYDAAAITALKSFNVPAPNDSVSWHSKVVEYKKIYYNGTMHFRHLFRNTTILSSQRCLIFLNVEKKLHL